MIEQYDFTGAPQTLEMVKRHMAETEALPRDPDGPTMAAHAERQIKELLALTIQFERQRYVPSDEKLRAVLEGLECEEIDNLLTQKPETLRAVGAEIAKAARLGAHLYQAQTSISPQQGEPK